MKATFFFSITKFFWWFWGFEVDFQVWENFSDCGAQDSGGEGRNWRMTATQAPEYARKLFGDSNWLSAINRMKKHSKLNQFIHYNARRMKKFNLLIDSSQGIVHANTKRQKQNKTMRWNNTGDNEHLTACVCILSFELLQCRRRRPCPSRSHYGSASVVLSFATSL